MEDIPNIVKALEISVFQAQDKQQLKQAEQFLENKRKQDNYAINLMIIINDCNQQMQIRQAALIQLKHTIERNWKLKANQNEFTISDNEKVKIKSSIIEALIQTVEQPKLSIIYEQIVYKVMELEKNQWQDFFALILQRLKSANSFAEFHGSLIALKQINKNFTLYMGSERKPLEEIVNSCFPLLEAYMIKIMNIYNDQTAHTLNVILKIFYNANHLFLSQYIKNSIDNLDRWMDLLLKVSKLPIDQQLLQPVQDYDEILKRAKNIHFKNIKMVGKILMRFIQKHFNVQFDSSSQLPALFDQKYSIVFLEMHLNYLYQQETNIYTSPKIVHYGLKYIFYGLSHPSILNRLQSEMDKLVFGVLMKNVYLTPQDEKIWKEDPQEYIRKEEDYTQLDNNNQNISLNLLEKICKLDNKQYLYKFLQFCHTVLTSNNDPYSNQPSNLIQKEAILRALGYLKQLVLQVEEFKIEEMIEKYLIPEFGSNVGFLRATACWVVGKYGGKSDYCLEFQNKANIGIVVKGLTQCLNDSELPVKVKAAISLSYLLDHKEAEDLLRPYLQNILECYLKIMDEIDNEAVVNALEAIVQSFHNEIVPYSYQLIQHLTVAFQKYCLKQQKQIENNDNNDDDDYDCGETELTAAGCLEAIKRILSSPLPEYIYRKLEPILVPILNYILSNEGVDYIDEGLSILNLLLFNQQTISQQMMFYFPILIYILVGIPNHQNINVTQLCVQIQLNEEQTRCIEDVQEGWGSEHIEAMLGCLKNYIQKGGVAFLQLQDIFGYSFWGLIKIAIDKTNEIGINGTQDYDMICISTLYICVVENNKGQIDQLIPDIIGSSYNMINKKTKKVSVLNIQVIAICMWYNVELSFQYLQSKNLVDELFKYWFGILPSFNKDFDKMRVMYGFTSLLNLEQSGLPQNIYNGMPQLIKELVKLSTEILQLREEEESVEQAEEYDEQEGNQNLKFGQNQQAKTNNDEDDDDSDFDAEEFEENRANLFYKSPLEEADEILYLEQSLQNIHNNNKQYYDFLMSQLNEQDLKVLADNFNESREQFNQYLKNQEEEKTKKIQQDKQVVL